jgi:hypothetical protein
MEPGKTTDEGGVKTLPKGRKATPATLLEDFTVVAQRHYSGVSTDGWGQATEELFRDLEANGIEIRIASVDDQPSY